MSPTVVPPPVIVSLPSEPARSSAAAPIIVKLYWTSLVLALFKVTIRSPPLPVKSKVMIKVVAANEVSLAIVTATAPAIPVAE